MTVAREKPEHLVSLAGGWSSWRDFLLRSAGFPAREMLPLGSPEATAAVEVLLGLEKELRQAASAALQALGQELERVGGARGAPRAWMDVLRCLKSGRYNQLARWEEPCAEALQAVRRAERARAEQLARVESLFERECVRIGDVLRAFARQERFHEALTWQNRTVYYTGVKPLLDRPSSDRSSATRGKEQLLVSYMQRYCLKNDTIGFFGPSGWGEFRDEGPALTCHPGTGLIASRRVFLEYWALDAMATRLSELPGVRPWLAPRCLPYVRVEGTTLHVPFGTDDLSPLQARVLAACDGETTARELARALLEEASPGAVTEAEVFAVLEDFAARKLILWALEIPTVGRTSSIEVLRRQLERIGDEDVRGRALGLFGELEAACAAVARAAGEARALDAAMMGIEETFTRLTGLQASRRPGELYAARTILYEDCRRDVQVACGPGLRERLGLPLSLMLTGGRWYTYQVAREYRAVLTALYRELRADSGSEDVELARFWVAMSAHLPRAGGHYPPSVQAVSEEFQRRWATLFGLPSSARRIELSAQALAPHVQAAFAAPGPGWPSARYHSPDILVAARSVEAAARGDYQLVLGELHIGMNTLEQEIFFDDHPNPAHLLKAMAEDLQQGRVTPTIPKEKGSSRMGFGISQHPDDAALEFGTARSFRPRAQTLALGELVLREEEGRLAVWTRDGRRHWDIVAFLDILLSDAQVPLLPAAPHTPRITLDGLVVCRESWRFTRQELPGAERETPLERFIGARELALAHGLPRFLFVKASAEKKPCYLDLESPASVEGFTRLVRRSERVTLTEMLPAPDQCWLADAEASTYTSELRVVAVDPERWRAP
jgi:hypothetical protein